MSEEVISKQETVIKREIEEELKESFLDYAMSVIVSRALPDVRDGLKPVHRRILYAMKELGNYHDKPYKKSARIVGETMGKFHPHGNSAIYETMVRMAQDFSLRYPLIDGQGNWGCFTGDTKVKLTDVRDLSFKELVKEHKEGKINYTYTVNKNGEIEIAKIENARLTKKNAEIIKITLDNGEEIRCTPNHKFMLKSGNYKEAQDLTQKDSLMPLNIRLSDTNDNLKPVLIGYYLVNQPKSKKWEPCHILADKYNITNKIYSRSKGKVRHHTDFNKLNNNPDNIIRMQWAEHITLHSKHASKLHKNPDYRERIAKGRQEYWSNEENREKASRFRSERNKEMWKDPKYRERMRENLSKFNKEYVKNNPEVRLKFSSRLKQLWKREDYREKMSKLKSKEMKERRAKGDPTISRTFTSEESKNIWNKKGHREFVSKIMRNLWKNKEYRNKRSEDSKKQWKDNDYKNKVIRTKVVKQVNQLIKKYDKVTPEIYDHEWVNGLPKSNTVLNYFDSFDEIIKEAEVYNHRIIDIEILEKKEDVYDLTIEETHNFALSAGIFVHNSVDGDPAAAERYTEARLAKLAEEILEDLNKETVDFVPNYNEELTEPVVLPSKIPNLLINGSSGIAVGMATNIPPHNLNEVCDGMIHLIENPEAEIKELMNIIKGPDFPTYGMICGRNGIIRSYLSGKGKVVIKSKYNIEQKGDKKDIIFTEIPYQVNKAQLLEEIALLVKSDKIEDISDIRDESNKEGMRVVISLKKNANEDVVLNQLFKFSRLKSSFGTNMVVLVNGEPRTLNLKEILVEFIKHRKEVVTRRTQYDLRQAKEREHKLEGLVIALNNIDDVVALIKSSKSAEEAVRGLMKNYSLSEIQSKNILDMKLQRLTGLEQAKLRSELEEVKKLITELDIILSDDKNILQVIKNETIEMKEKYGDERRTKILDEEGEIEVEDLIEEEKMVVTLTKDGYVKRVPLSIYKTQNRGGKGVIATGTKDEDFVKDVFVASTHDNILCFTKNGVVHWLKVYNVPQGSRQSKGKAIVNLLNLSDDSPSALVPLTSFESNKYLLFATEKGNVKKTKLELYSHPRKGGIIAITLDNDDKLVDVMITDGSHDLLLATLKGAAIRFSESEVRPTGRAASGVRGIRLRKDDKLVSAVYLDKEQDILTVTTKGYGKRTPSTDYRIIGRSGKGVRNIKTTQKNGEEVVSVLGVDEKEGVMLISKNGIIIRMEISKISQIGRNTQGVRLMNLESEDSVVAAAKVLSEDVDLNGDNKVNKNNDLNIDKNNQGGDMAKNNKNNKEEYAEDDPEDTSEELEDEVENDEIDTEEEGVVKGYLKDEFKTMKKGSKDDEDEESDEDEEESDDDEEEY